MKISIKELNFRFTLKLPEVMRTSTFIIKKKIKNPYLNSESLSELKNSKTEVSLKNIFIQETMYSGNLYDLLLRMLKVFIAIVDHVN